MNYQKIEPVRPEPMEPLPDTDTLVRFENGLIVRLRITAKTTDGELRTKSPEPGTNETINMKFRCSLCKDESGDVRLGLDGNHLVLAGEVHGVSLKSLASDELSFDGWLAEHSHTILQTAQQIAAGLDQVIARYHFPTEQPPAPRVTIEMYNELLQRIEALEEQATA